MAENLSNLINQLAEKAGISVDNKQLIELLAHTELNNIKVHQDIVNGLQRNLLSVTDAKNDHPDIKRHYFAETMSNVDRVLNKIYKDLDLDDDVIAEFNKESSSTKRIALVASKIKEIGEKAADEAKGKSKDDNKELKTLQTQVNTLNEQLRIEKEGRAADKTAHQGALNGVKIDTHVFGKLGALKTVFDTLPAEVKNTTIKTLLDKELQDSNAHIVVDDNGNIVLKKKDGTNFYNEQQQQVTLDKFIETTLSKSKSLINSQQQQQQQQTQQSQQQQQQNPQNGFSQQQQNQNQPNAGLMELLKESSDTLANGNPTNILGMQPAQSQ